MVDKIIYQRLIDRELAIDSELYEQRTQKYVIGRSQSRHGQRSQPRSKIVNGDRKPCRRRARRKEDVGAFFASEVDEMKQRAFVEPTGLQILDHQRARRKRRWQIDSGQQFGRQNSRACRVRPYRSKVALA